MFLLGSVHFGKQTHHNRTNLLIYMTEKTYSRKMPKTLLMTFGRRVTLWLPALSPGGSRSSWNGAPSGTACRIGEGLTERKKFSHRVIPSHLAVPPGGGGGRTGRTTPPSSTKVHFFRLLILHLFQNFRAQAPNSPGVSSWSTFQVKRPPPKKNLSWIRACIYIGKGYSSIYICSLHEQT